MGLMLEGNLDGSVPQTTGDPPTVTHLPWGRMCLASEHGHRKDLVILPSHFLALNRLKDWDLSDWLSSWNGRLQPLGEIRKQTRMSAHAETVEGLYTYPPLEGEKVTFNINPPSATSLTGYFHSCCLCPFSPQPWEVIWGVFEGSNKFLSSSYPGSYLISGKWDNH